MGDIRGTPDTWAPGYPHQVRTDERNQKWVFTDQWTLIGTLPAQPETREEFLTRRVAERGADIEHMLEVMADALESLEEDNDTSSAEIVLRTCLRKFNRK